MLHCVLRGVRESALTSKALILVQLNGLTFSFLPCHRAPQARLPAWHVCVGVATTKDTTKYSHTNRINYNITHFDSRRSRVPAPSTAA